MTINSRLYIVVDKAGVKRLVEASNQAQAIRHVARADYTCKAASSFDVLAVMKDGVAHEVASDEPPFQAELT